MAVSDAQIQSDAAALWSESQNKDLSLFTALKSTVTANEYTAQNVLDLLNALRTSCDSYFAGSYTIEVPSSTGPMMAFASRAINAFDTCAMANAQDVTPMFDFFANVPGMRLDAAIDVARLAVAWIGKLTLFASPIPPAAPPNPTNKVMGFLEQGLTLTGIMAFAIPEVGPLVGGGLQVASGILKIFFPPPDGAQQGYDQLATNLQADLINQDINTAAKQLTADGGWLASLYNLMSDAAIASMPPNDLREWIESNVQQPLAPKIAADTPTLPALLTLIGYVDVPGVIEVIAYGISTYLALCRQSVVTSLSLASIAQSDDLDDCLEKVGTSVGNFVTFKQAVTGSVTPDTSQSAVANWAAQFNALLFQVLAGRLATVAPSNYSYTDKGTPQPTNFVPEKPGQYYQSYTNFFRYVVAVAQLLDQLYAQHFACIASWNSSISSWAQQLPTFAPSDSPSATSWTAAAPNGAVWVPGAQVQYAYSYVNENCTSPMGQWSPSITVGTQSCPTLRLTPDPRGSSTVYWIFRRVKLPSASDFNSLVTLAAPDASATSYTDSDVNTVGSAPPSVAGSLKAKA